MKGKTLEGRGFRKKYLISLRGAYIPIQTISKVPGGGGLKNLHTLIFERNFIHCDFVERFTQIGAKNQAKESKLGPKITKMLSIGAGNCQKLCKNNANRLQY